MILNSAHVLLSFFIPWFWRNKFLIKSKSIPTNGSDMSCYLVQLIFTFPQLICLEHQSSLCRHPGPLSPPPSYRECCLTSQSNPPRWKNDMQPHQQQPERMNFIFRLNIASDVLNCPIWRVSSQSKRRPSVLLSARLKECILTSLNFRYEEIFLTVWTLLLSDLSSLSTKYTRTQEYRHFIFSIWILINQKCTIYMIA